MVFTRIRSLYFKWKDINFLSDTNSARQLDDRNVNRKGKLFLSNYEYESHLGAGGFGDVFAAIRANDRLPVAIKFIKKETVHSWEKIEEKEVPLECSLLNRVSHVDGVVNLIEYCDVGKEFVIVMERMVPCQNLGQIIQQSRAGSLGEQRARIYFRQLVNAVVKCYQAGVLHRDIKGENIVVNLSNHVVKLIDFGLATYRKPSMFGDVVGTPLYYSPEMILRKQYHGDKASVWSLGIVLYMMVYGSYPFWELVDDEKALSFPDHIRVGDHCLDLMNKLLQTCPKKRILLRNIHSHPWMSGP